MLQHQTSSSTPTSLQPVQQLQQQQQQHFARGDKASVSVRLRKKKSEGNNVNNHRRLANSRHSGDFSFFSSAQLHQHHHLPAVPIRKKMEDETDANSKGDWAYITFPNGVPQVHEIQTNGEQQQQPQQQQQQVVTNGAAGPANRTPVKVVTREVPGILPLNPRLFASSHALNNNEVIIPHPNQPPSYEQARKRQSGDFSHFRHQRQLSVEQQQRLYNGGGSQQQQQQQQQNRRQSMDPSQMRKSTKGFLETDLNSSPSTRRHHYRRKSEQHHHHHSNNNNKSSKRCSGEFQFTQPQQQQQQQEQEEVVVMRRQPGLGRRAATQIEIEQKRKNSYNAALYKSQENLVKASVMSDEASLEKTSATLRKGLLWTQRDKLFSRWKERYFVLTRDYLNCFKKGTSRLSEMGEFLYKVKIGEIEDIELLDKRGYLTVCVSTVRDGKIYLRKTEGIRDWHRLIKECHDEAKKKRIENFWSRKQITDSSSIENWLQKKKSLLNLSDSTPDINKAAAGALNGEKDKITLTELSALYKDAEEADDAAPCKVIEEESNANTKSPVVKLRRSRNGLNGADHQRKPKIINRLSLMSDIELPDFGQHQNIDLEKGIFVKKSNKSLLDSQSNDSGNHSMSTNASLASSASSKSKESTTEESGEVVHKTVLEVKHRSSSSDRSKQQHRRSSYAHGLQITHV